MRLYIFFLFIFMILTNFMTLNYAKRYPNYDRGHTMFILTH